MLTSTIDLDAIAHNTRMLRAHTEAQLMCVVKADAYNHGVERCVPVMEDNGADAFGVATFAEARRVRGLTSKPVLAWLWDVGEDIPEGVDVGVPSVAHLRSLIDAPSAPTIYLKVDTGMHRSGIDEKRWGEAYALAASAERQGKCTVAGLMTHLSCADDPSDPYTDVQAAAFRRAIAQARQEGLAVERNHMANSPATWTRPDLHFDMVRPGLSLYGLEPVDGLDHGLKPAMTWSAPVVTVKPMRKGEATSYARTWVAPEDGFSAVVPAGYADGVQRAWQGALEVAIGGRAYPQVGRVSMDQIVVWLGDNAAHVAPGDEAVLFGDASALAKRAGTINYEVVCAPRGRTTRTYIGEGQ
ncbi:alanine racemase [Corynebacterium sp. zg912]|uniref:Alanine racemase n=1 Tax=Corynebacterium wankanglinii TaxID=2735136 RepID=A0A7H0KAZ6_9CORY|nr:MULTISPECIES: alanine racemase [Corynebacterium]MBA1836781.1 alanine racemase [Corynebacterium wankanglinii]MCR5929878.1 alanine racemase [Corynebacterium sp. zg912]QNP94462.1 alanine racemase [Corynebacterium wankanglinii]